MVLLEIVECLKDYAVGVSLWLGKLIFDGKWQSKGVVGAWMKISQHKLCSKMLFVLSIVGKKDRSTSIWIVRTPMFVL